MTLIPLEERQKWVGASEVAALFGASRFLTKFELWHRKAGNIPAPDLDGNERVQAGRHLEPAIASWAASKWEWPIRNVTDYSPHPTVEGLGASLDFETQDGEPVEIKLIDSLVFRDEWQAERDTILDAPLDYLLQVQAQLACRPKAERGWLVTCVGGNRLYRMEIERHKRIIARIEGDVSMFWASVREGREPKPNFQADAATIAMLYAGTGPEVVDLTSNNRLPDLCAEYMAAHQIEREAAERKSAAMAEIKHLIGDAKSALIAGGYRVKACHIGGGTYTREPYWRVTISKQKEYA